MFHLRLKKAAALGLSAAMALSVTACGSSSSSSSETATEDGTEIEEVVFTYATFNNIPSDEDLQDVEDAINEITREKIGVEVTLMPISIAEYTEKVNLMLQGGEQVDIYESLGNFVNCVSTDMCYPLDDLIAEYGAETMEVVGEDFLDATRVNGTLYGIPTYKNYALNPMLIYREDIAEELGLDMDSIESLDDITAILEAVKEAYPDMTPLAPVLSGDIGLSRMVEETDYLSDSYDSVVGVLIGDDMTVTDFYSTDTFAELCETARYWHENGLVMQDAATTTSDAAECMASGNYFAYIASYGYPPEDTATSLEAQCGGYDLSAVMLGEAYLDTSAVNSVTWMIASTTDVPEAAMKFLNLTFTDEEVINLLIYGIEGRDYVMNDDGTVSYPEGEDASTVPYTAQLSCGTLGNYFLQYPLEGTSTDSLEWQQEMLESAPTSPAMGFVFDSDDVTTQYTAVSNVLDQYVPGLLCGSLDPDTEIEKFQQALTDAGYWDILEAKQEQLDAWLAETE